MAKVLTRVIRQLFSKGSSLAQSESRGQPSARADGFLICMTSARAARPSPSSPPVLHPLSRCRRTEPAVAVGVLRSHHDFLAAAFNDKRQLIKGLVLREMYPSSRLPNQSQPCEEEGTPRGGCGSYVLISRVFLHGDGDYRKISGKIARHGLQLMV